MDTNLRALQELIETEVFVKASEQTIISQSGRESNWLFDFRRIIMRPAVLKQVSALFWERFQKQYPFQIGCLEAAGIPLATGISYALYTEGHHVNAFFIRKSRKKHGLLQMVEGELTDEPIILVDDLINSGASFIRQVEVLEGLGKKVLAVFALLRFRDEDYYEYFHKKGIAVVSLFSLNDFTQALGVQNLLTKSPVPVPMPFTVAWYFKSENPNYHYVVPKSAPALDDTRLYFGSDSGNFWALNQHDGSVAWKFKVGLHAKGKHIFSAPTVHEGIVYFGSYDGNFYALDAETGARRWVFREADWIGSSPCLMLKHSAVVVGLEFGLWKKQGGIVALDLKTGNKIWEFRTGEYVHASPIYVQDKDLIICGANNGVVYALDGKRGNVVWEYQTNGPVKAAAAYDAATGLVFIGSHDAMLYALDGATGQMRWAYKTNEAIYATPAVAGGLVYISSLDKKLYALQVKDGSLQFAFMTSGRVFASPVVIEGSVFIGSNDGRLYELDAVTGTQTSLFQAVERITNRIAYNEATKTLFLPTFANEILCLTRS